MSRGAARRSGPIGDDELAQILASLKGRPLALAVSGGADSMALMHLVARWLKLQAHVPQAAPVSPSAQDQSDGRHAPPHGWIAAMGGDIARLPPVVVLTVDHGLRPDAARDAAFVREAAARYGMPCAVLRWDGEKPSTGVQDAARNARRALMRDLVASEPAAVEAACGVRSAARVLLMAHHLEDQAETVLMRLGRGSGLDGLKGMAAETTAMERAGEAMSIARPFLAISKQRLLDTLAASGVAWVDDPSNADERFERVRVRKALATLAELGIGADKIALSARRLADAADWIDHAACDGDAESRRFVHGIDWHGGVYAELTLPDTPAFDVPRYAAVRTLRQVLRSFGGDGREPELQQLETLVEIIKAKYAALPDDMTLGGCRLVFVSRGAGGRRLLVFREGGGARSPEVSCAPGYSVPWDGGRYTIHAARDAAPGGVVRALGTQGWAALKREAPALAGLGWPPEAAATLPVVEADGRIVAYPGVAAAIEGITRTGDRIQAASTAVVFEMSRHYFAAFRRLDW